MGGKEPQVWVAVGEECVLNDTTCGSVLQFNGTDDVTLGSSIDATGPRTFSLWINLADN